VSGIAGLPAKREPCGGEQLALGSGCGLIVGICVRFEHLGAGVAGDTVDLASRSASRGGIAAGLECLRARRRRRTLAMCRRSNLVWFANCARLSWSFSVWRNWW